MSDMGWSRYIAAQDAAADMEMAADEKVAALIADEGVRGMLEHIQDRLAAEIGQANVDMLPFFFWAAAGEYCIDHADRREWHPANQPHGDLQDVPF